MGSLSTRGKVSKVVALEKKRSLSGKLDSDPQIFKTMYSLIEALKKVKDFRRQQGQRYPLWLILLIVISGLMTGHLGYRALADFGKAQHWTWNKYLGKDCPKMPSYSTLKRVMERVEIEELIKVFNQWAKQPYWEKGEIEWLAVDGKSLRATVENACDRQQNFVSLVSVFNVETGWVLGLRSMENKKESEIGCIQELIEDIALTNKVYTADALHCQRVTVELITSQKNEYLVSVKNNQPQLYKKLEEVGKSHVPQSKYTFYEKEHGRLAIREVSVFKLPTEVKKKWSKSQSCIKVKRSGMRAEGYFEETSYYLSSCQGSAQELGTRIQGHWQIENRLHWVKDVIFKEDGSRIRKKKPATNMAILLTFGMNIYRGLGFISITEGQRWLSGRVERLMTLVDSSMGEKAESKKRR